VLALGLLATVCLLLAGCGSGSAHPRDPLLILPVPTHVTVQTRNIAGLGAILTTSEGYTLYMFPPDAGSRVSCTGPCAGTWPPLTIARTAKPTAGPGVNQEDLATLDDPNSGADIVTYGGYPLYRYAGDTTPGTANGQDLFDDGGPWYVLNPTADPITTNPTSTP
jgi:predicted lipoprotein with Yx(FWY)xxD motif